MNKRKRKARRRQAEDELAIAIDIAIFEGGMSKKQVKKFVKLTLKHIDETAGYAAQ